MSEFLISDSDPIIKLANIENIHPKIMFEKKKKQPAFRVKAFVLTNVRISPPVAFVYNSTFFSVAEFDLSFFDLISGSRIL